MVAQNRKKRRVLVIGIGNILLKDDGIGIHAIAGLRLEPPPAGVDAELIDAGNASDLAVFTEAGIDKLIIIDAIQARGKPGSIYRLTPDVFEAESGEFVSAHDLNLRESLAMMRLAGTLPAEVIVIGVEPGEMGWGMTPTPEVQAKLPELIHLVLQEIQNV